LADPQIVGGRKDGSLGSQPPVQFRGRTPGEWIRGQSSAKAEYLCITVSQFGWTLVHNCQSICLQIRTFVVWICEKDSWTATLVDASGSMHDHSVFIIVLSTTTSRRSTFLVQNCF